MASEVPGGPQCLHALLFDPGATLALLLSYARMLPSAGSTASGSAAHLSRLNHTAYRPLCTLRSLGYPRTTQHSIPAASRQPAIETAGKRQSGLRPTYRLSGWNGGVTVYVREVANNA